jgi:hypothetical protein
MKYTSTYNNILLLLYLLIPIGIGLKIVVSETYLLNTTFSIFAYLFFVLISFYFLIKKYVYIIDISDDIVIIKHVFKSSIKTHFISEIDKVTISITTGNTPNVVLNFSDNTKTSFSCSDRNDLKRIYEFFILKNINIIVLPKERINNFR